MGEEDTIWDVPNLEEAGLSAKGGSYYVRRQSVLMWQMLWDKLDETPPRPKTCWIQGPPGVGKSTELFGWLMYVAQTRNLNVMWIHRYHESDFRVVLKFGNNWNTGLVSSIDGLPRHSGLDIVVFDGLRGEMIRAVQASKFAKCPFIICCTSYGQSHLSSGAFEFLDYDVPFQMTSWEKGDYEHAIQRGIVIADVNDNDNPVEPYLDVDGRLTRFCHDLLDNKFRLAGLSMSFMQTPTLRLLPYLRSCFDAVSDIRLLLRGLSGFRTSSYVLSLIGVTAKDPDQSCVVSEFVLMALSVRANLAFVAEARATLPNNSSWQGWVFELEVLVRLRQSNGLCLRAIDSTTTTDTFSASVIITYDLKTNNAEHLFDRLVRHNTIAIPTQWNNAAFDFVHIAVNGDESDNRYRVTFFNATTAARHYFDYQYVAQFLEVLFPLPSRPNKRPRFEVTVRFVVVIPPDANGSFACFEENVEYVQNFDGTFRGATTKELVRD